MRIGGHRLSPSDPLFVIAEIGLNHSGQVDRALALVDAAAAAGASAVKLQTLAPERLVAAHCPAPAHVQAASLREFFGRFVLDEAAHRAVRARAHARGVAFLSTPFDEDAVERLVRVGVDAIKIASGDLTHLALIECAARTGRPLVLSTGMSGIEEVERAVASARRAGAADIALLHCVSAYPTPLESQNLKAIATLARVFDVPVGLSDHGTEPYSAALARALGASVYEKHIVLAGDVEAIDAPVSATPDELRAIVQLARRADCALGDGVKTCSPAEAVNVTASRRGLYAGRRLRAGTRLAAADILALRPAGSLGADRYHDLLGAVLVRDLESGDPFNESDLHRTSTQGADREVA